MEVDPNLSSLLQNLKLDGPWIPPKTWESIPSESGAAALSADAGNGSRVPICDLSTISEAILVRLVLNALHGVKSVLLEIEKLSAQFCSTPADRTAHRVPTLWCRSSSTNALGKMLKSVARSGLLLFFLRNFVNHYLCLSPDAISEGGGRMCTNPPYSLVNQAFSVAVGKVLEGYICALNTLMASVRLRRSSKSVGGAGSLTSVIHAEVTVLEVYLHTKELRTLIEALANICLPRISGLASLGEDLTVDTDLGFDNFPRGADLLTYLYVQLRDADPVHRALLKFLFVRSCEPYCGFIKSWIYQASTEDPYGEFFVVYSDNSPTSDCIAGSLDDLSTKERDCISVPCFLKDFYRPLLRAGRQLQVLVKLLNLCNSAVIGAYVPCDLANLVDVLPFWDGMSSDSVSLLNPITFTRKGIEALILKREVMYQTMLEKLQIFFLKLDIRYQRINQTIIPFDTVQSLIGKRKGGCIPFFMVSDGDFNLSASANEVGTVNLDPGRQDTDASSTSDESLYELEPIKDSDCSSVNGSGEEIEPEGLSELQGTWYTNKSILQNLSGAKRLYSSCHNTGGSIDPVAPFSHQDHENENSSHTSPLQSGDTEFVRMSKTVDGGFQSGKCWPLGGLLKNPFHADMKNRGQHLHFTGCGIQMTDGKRETLEEEESYFGEMLVPSNCELDPTRRIQIMNGIHKSLSSYIHQSWNCHDYYDLSMNPVLTKSDWLRTVHISRGRSCINSDGSFIPYFDFTSVTDPCKTNSENMFSGPDNGSQVQTPVLVDTGPAVGLNKFSGDCVQANMEAELVLASVCPSRKANLLPEDVPPSASSGANMEGLLKYSCEDVTITSGDSWCGMGTMFEIPLDIIIEKCIVQEILLQYKYVSSFTIKLLEQGFDLHEHLSALRRYHFMELADWTDSFIVSLCDQKWSVIEPEQKLAEIQGLLDLALQSSSCESDHYKERLFVYIKGDNIIPLSNPSLGVHAFDFLMLGYRVDWPVSIIVTQDALKIYAEIFSFLIQVRLAVFSLSGVWRSLKAIMQSTYHRRYMGSGKMENFKVLMRIRQQINHFVSTLQQYVHSQLSDVSWCRFQHSLKHQVKDMLDLEMVHMRYLADALHICFLSVETKAIATVVKNILQCALDFQMCLTRGRFDVGSDGADPSDLCSQINFSRVFAVKTAFEKNLKDLYLLYLRSPKHGEFSLCRFWDYLNYNNYYLNTISKETGHLYL